MNERDSDLRKRAAPNPEVLLGIDDARGRNDEQQRQQVDSHGSVLKVLEATSTRHSLRHEWHRVPIKTVLCLNRLRSITLSLQWQRSTVLVIAVAAGTAVLRRLVMSLLRVGSLQLRERCHEITRFNGKLNAISVTAGLLGGVGEIQFLVTDWMAVMASPFHKESIIARNQ